MLEKVFNALVITSIFGSLFFALLILIKPFTKKYFSARWHYYIYFCVILVLIFPIKINIAQTENDLAKENAIIKYIPYEKIKSSISFENAKITQKAPIDFSKIWLATATALFVLKISKYAGFTLKLKRKSYDYKNKNLCVSKSVKIRKSAIITSPFVSGLFFPTIYIPETDMTEEEIKYVLRHEITHLKRCDVLIKWITMLAKCVHWFNPFVYFLAKELNLWCEISCDVSVTQNMDNTGKQNYISTILKLIEKSRKNQMLTTSMASGKNILGKRFRFIKLYKKRKTAFISAFLSISMIISVYTLNGIAIGIVNKDVNNKEIKPHLNERINPPNKNKLFENDVEKKIEEDEISIFEKEIIEENEIIVDVDEEKVLDIENEIVEDEKINMDAEDTNEEKYFAGDVIIEEFDENMDTKRIIDNENSNSILFKSPSDVVNLSTSHTWFNYSFDKKFSYTVTVIPDNNGEISLFFDTEFNGATANIYINHIDRPNMGWGYRFPTDSKTLYRFVGFEKNEKYQVTISSYFPGHYNIIGKALII